jgi:hypothetical protein
MALLGLEGALKHYYYYYKALLLLASQATSHDTAQPKSIKQANKQTNIQPQTTRVLLALFLRQASRCDLSQG